MIIRLIALLCYCCMCASFILPPKNCTVQPPIQEISSLVALYNNTQGQQWTNQWPIRANSSVDEYNPCAVPWYGVSCDFAGKSMGCHVVGLSLIDNELRGSLPSSLVNLSFLKALDLFSNELSGDISQLLEPLVNLEVLDLSVNSFQGSLPLVGPALKYFDTSYNRFSGNIPMPLLHHAALEKFDVAGNVLTGTIPDFSNSTKLYQLFISQNLFHGTIPQSLLNLTSLESLALGNNNLDSVPFPSWMCNFSRLQELSMMSMGVSGSLPSCVGKLSNLTLLLLSRNDMTGTIPNEIGNLTQLLTLSLNNNAFTGSIPDVLTSLPALQVLDLYMNRLSGSIPNSIGNLGSTSYGLEFYSNFLTGTIPHSIGALVLSTDMMLFSNLLGGTIPPSVCNLTSLLNLELSQNQLTGSIPSCIGRLVNAADLTAFQNFLTGSIPPSVGDIQYFNVFEMQNNLLTGPLPLRVGQYSFPQLLVLMQNYLTGSVPPSYGQSTTLEDLLLENNLLSISLPDLLSSDSFALLYGLGLSYNFVYGSMTGSLPRSLQYLDLSGVQLQGPIPVRFLQSPTLQYLALQSNAITGSLPPEVFTTTIARVFLNDNALRGSFPSLLETDNCTTQYLSLSNNALTGRLPSYLARCKLLTSFVASSMQLTGPIHGLFNTLPLLQELVLTNNALTGSLEDVFAASTASGLVFNAAYNQFTGSLPTQSLQEGRWAALILTQNCLSGTLPSEALCANTGLSEVLLSGLHTAPQCRSNVVVLPASWRIYASYEEASTAIGGTLPGCLLSLPQLSFVALSGNALQGSIPRDVNLSRSLQGLDLSHNVLTGSIPSAVLQAELQLLDLSFNRFAGSLSTIATDYYATDASSKVSLQVNMLSGELPESWISATNIDVLNGNMFSCVPSSLTKTANNPVNDPEAGTYTCGSSSTNIALLVTILLAVATIAVVMVVHYGLSSPQGVWRRWWATEWQDVQCRLRSQWIYVMIGGALIGMLMVSVVLYAALAVTTSAYADLYIWVVSLSLQQGTVATALLFLWLWACTVLVLEAKFRGMGRMTRSEATRVSAGASDAGKPAQPIEITGQRSGVGSTTVWQGWSMRTILVVGVVVLLHAVPVFAVNLVYVYATTLRLSLTRLTVIIVAMAMFKLLWNSGLNLLVLRYAHILMTPLQPTTVTSLLANVAMFNLIVSPIVTESLVSPNCFQYAFSRIPSDTYAVAGGTCYWIFYYSSAIVGSTIPLVAFPCMSFDELQATYNSGSVLTGGNYNMVIISTFSNGEASTVNFQAGFAYNFQCSFSLLEAFVHVFVYRYAIGIFVVPVLWLMLKQIQMWAFRHWGGSQVVFRAVSGLLPPLYRLLDVDPTDSDDAATDMQAVAVTNLKLIRQYFQTENDTQTPPVCVYAETLYLRLVMDVAVGLSFGLLFPLLGLLALVSAVADLWTTKWMLAIWQRQRKWLTEAHCDGIAMGTESSEYLSCLVRSTQQLEMAYRDIAPRVMGELGSVLGYSALLWGFALYDILGREVGAVQGLWVFVVVFMMPYWAEAMLRLERHLLGAVMMPRVTSPANHDSVDLETRQTEMRASAVDSSSSISLGDDTTATEIVLNPLRALDPDRTV